MIASDIYPLPTFNLTSGLTSEDLVCGPKSMHTKKLSAAILYQTGVESTLRRRPHTTPESIPPFNPYRRPFFGRWRDKFISPKSTDLFCYPSVLERDREMWIFINQKCANDDKTAFVWTRETQLAHCRNHQLLYNSPSVYTFTSFQNLFYLALACSWDSCLLSANCT